ncbi:Microtubule-associated protein TORTIFOLIA1 [Camellia lanceoleosa]|uniref:Microtubule-associated protein TORTIFOLIA1 n=1 Tax=Camellia lanceoleosa TaxID=1840588 RepID=A0ACC0IRW4_9ERIC|nr:Microtubule-associated protein TORTIFOLIA1 [Camellia lanceoleosa]
MILHQQQKSNSNEFTSTQIFKICKNLKPTFKITFLFMVELKQRILTSLSKLSNRDTHQIAIEDLEKIIQNLSPDGVSMLLNCLYESINDPKLAVKRESPCLLTIIYASHSYSTATHLTKIIADIVKRLKDSHSGVREPCRDAIGALSSQYLKDEEENGRGSWVGGFAVCEAIV